MDIVIIVCSTINIMAGITLLTGWAVKKMFPSLAKSLHQCEYRTELEELDKSLEGWTTKWL
jgi:hypothetical protein